MYEVSLGVRLKEAVRNAVIVVSVVASCSSCPLLTHIKNRISLLLSSKLKSRLVNISSLLPGTVCIIPASHIPTSWTRLKPPYLATPEPTNASIRGPVAGMTLGERDMVYCRAWGT